jgi:SAM-dependent methyltransferase
VRQPCRPGGKPDDVVVDAAALDRRRRVGGEANYRMARHRGNDVVAERARQAGRSDRQMDEDQTITPLQRSPSREAPPTGDVLRQVQSAPAAVPLPIADKRAAIAQLVPDRSFADVGGLWGLHNEMVSLALNAGASSAAMIDLTPLTNPAWSRLREHVSARTARPFTQLHADAGAQNFRSMVGSFDVVHSAGLIYHLPDPISYLINLRDVTNQYLIVSSMTLPDKLSCNGKELDLTGGHFLSTHHLDQDQREIIDAHFSSLSLQKFSIIECAQNLLLPNGTPNTGPWWWLFTVESLRRMLSAAGLEILSVGESWPGRAHSFLCRPRLHASQPHILAQDRKSDPARRTAPTKSPEELAAAALEFARQTFSLGTERWAAGIAFEGRFWQNQIKTGGGKWTDDFQRRISTNAPLDDRMEVLVSRTNLETVSILDVGAGPITTIGRVSKYSQLRVRATDPLAHLYSLLLSAGNIVPAIETEFAPAEALSYFQSLHSFDIVHSRNSLDHSLNPLLGILQMLNVLRPNGAIYLRHHSNEAQKEEYSDFHQYNFEVRDGRFLIWNLEHVIDISAWLSGLAEVETWPGGLGAEVVIRPLSGRMLDFNLSDEEMALIAADVRREVNKTVRLFAAGADQ